MKNLKEGFNKDVKELIFLVLMMKKLLNFSDNEIPKK